MCEGSFHLLSINSLLSPTFYIVWQDDDSDELDEEFEKLKNSNIKSRRLKVLEEIQLAEGALQDTKVALKKSEEQVRLMFKAMFFHSFTSNW